MAIERTMESRDTGTLGVLYIQDSGSYVAIGIRIKSTTYKAKPLTFVVQRPGGKRTFKNVNVPVGGELYFFNSFAQPISGDVKVTLQATGTTELGGPTTLVKKISRTESVPFPPIIQAGYMKGANSAYIYWNARETGGAGAGITRFDLGYGTSPTKPTTIIKSASPANDYQGNRTVSKLATNTTYYFFVRATNKKGTSPWSDPYGVVTSGGVMVMYENRWRNAEPYVKTKTGWKRARAYVKSGDTWKMTR